MSSSAPGMTSVWTHLFDLHSAFLRHDLAEIAAQIAVFPLTDQTKEHVDVSGAFMFALARYEADKSEFAQMVLDSYKDTYEQSYSELTDVLIADPTEHSAAQDR